MSRTPDRVREDTHASREQDLTPPSAHMDDETPWVASSNLEAPVARPGFVQRWVRFDLTGRDVNLSKALREGWRPRARDTVPTDYHLPPAMKSGDHTDAIIVQDLILCEMPAKKNAQRRAYYEMRTARQTAAIQQQLRQEIPGKFLATNVDSSVAAVGKDAIRKGRIPAVADE